MGFGFGHRRPKSTRGPSEGHGGVSWRSTQDVQMAAARKTFAGGYGATDAASQIVGLAIPIFPDDVVPDESGGDLAWSGPHPAAVERPQRDQPSTRTAFG